MIVGFHDIQTNNLEDGILQNMIQDAIPRTTFTRLKNNQGINNISLIPNSDQIILTDGNQKGYYISVPYDIRVDGETQSLHGNTRNKLAKQFIQKFSVDYILNLEAEYIDKHTKKQNQAEIEKIEMQRIFETEIQPLFTNEFLSNIKKFHGSFNELSIKDYTSGIQINLKCDFKNPLDRWGKDYHNSIEIFFDNHNLNQFSMLTNGKQGRNERVNGLTLEQVKSECKRVISEIESAINEYNDLQIQADEKAKREQQLNTFIWNTLLSKDVTIFKKKNTYVAVRNGMKYAIGDSKRGKDYSISQNKLLDMIMNKGYTEFYNYQKTENGKYIVWLTTDELKQLPFKNVEVVD